jgi:hypothetical protein
MRHRRRSIRVARDAVVGVAWFSRDEWLKLVDVVPDRSELDDTFEQWEQSAEGAAAMLRGRGIAIKKVMIEVEALMAWCREHKRQPNGPARADYVGLLLREEGKKKT